MSEPPPSSRRTGVFSPDEETSDAMREAFRGPREEPTLQPCAACEHCAYCAGTHLVTTEQNAIFHEELAKGERR